MIRRIDHCREATDRMSEWSCCKTTRFGGFLRLQESRVGSAVRLAAFEHQPEDGPGGRLVIGILQFCLAGDRCDLPVEIGVGLGRGPDGEHQVMRIEQGDLSAVDPGTDAFDVVPCGH